MSDLIWDRRPKLRKPVMVCAFKGWNDAGEAASAALSFIRGSFESEDVAQIDPEEYYDFTAVRPDGAADRGPHARDGMAREHVLDRRGGRGRGRPRDAGGVEPSLRWRRFTDNVIDTARELDVGMVITLGALLADVPHSRPVAITGIGSEELARRAARLRAAQLRRSHRDRRRAPERLRGRRYHLREPVGLGAPLRGGRPNPKVALALVRGFEGIAGLAVDAGELESAAEDYERQVSAAVASDPEVKAFVERLESAMDEVTAENPPDEESLPSADTIARDFQRFLRQRGPEDS